MVVWLTSLYDLADNLKASRDGLKLEGRSLHDPIPLSSRDGLLIYHGVVYSFTMPSIQVREQVCLFGCLGVHRLSRNPLFRLILESSHAQRLM